MAMSSEKTTALVAKHLEFLGYTATPQDDGWTFAAHPTRPDLCFRAVPFGIRVVALFDLGKLTDGLRAEWVEFANRCNNAGIFVRFSLSTRTDGGHSFRTTAVFHGEYAKAAFGGFIDAWHDDVALMKHAPNGQEAESDGDDDEDEEVGAAEVTH